MRRGFLIPFLIVAVIGCTNQDSVEESLIMYNDADYQRLVHELTQEGVDFYEYGGNQIFYPITERAKIVAIKEKIHGPVDKARTGVIVKTIYAEEIKNRFQESGLEYKMAAVDGDMSFTWDVAVNEQAKSIVAKVLGHEW